ncbi:MAG: hypothetical protein K8T25_17545 [Planctomycetia bacterium]|nr:hypothetical protein [Planctomycetia bacterium]
MSDLQPQLQRVEERLRAVEVQLGHLTAQLTSEHSGMTQTVAQLRHVCESHAKLLVGSNGHSLMTRVAMLEDSEQSRRWSLRAIWGAVVGMLVKVLHDVLSNGK